MIAGACARKVSGVNANSSQTATTQPATGPLTASEFRALYDELRGQLPWGADDRRGALNYLTPAEVHAAVSEVRQGLTISLAPRSETRSRSTIRSPPCTP